MRQSVAVAVAGLAAASAQPAPADVAQRAISQLVQQLPNPQLWGYEYGPAIQMSAMWEATAAFPGQDWSGVLNGVLDAFQANATSNPAGMILANTTVPWGYSIGDVAGLMPIAYLSRADFYGNPATNASSPDWQVIFTTADRYVLGWPLTWSDGTISRNQNWPGENGTASFLWQDDQFMGTTLAARLGAHAGVPIAKSRAYLDFAIRNLVNFAAHCQDPTDGVYWHGKNMASGDHSCCKWGRANGWTAMAKAEVVKAVTAGWPSHPLLPQLIAVWKAHAAGLASLQDKATGLWHQVVDHPETYLETSATAMNLYSLATGVLGGWLDKATYDPIIRSAWGGVASMVDAAGVVHNISCGTGIGGDVAFYEARSTAYNASSPGLGSVFRAALAFNDYIKAYGW